MRESALGPPAFLSDFVSAASGMAGIISGKKANTQAQLSLILKASPLECGLWARNLDKRCARRGVQKSSRWLK